MTDIESAPRRRRSHFIVRLFGIRFFSAPERRRGPRFSASAVTLAGRTPFLWAVFAFSSAGACLATRGGSTEWLVMLTLAPLFGALHARAATRGGRLVLDGGRIHIEGVAIGGRETFAVERVAYAASRRTFGDGYELGLVLRGDSGYLSVGVPARNPVAVDAMIEAIAAARARGLARVDVRPWAVTDASFSAAALATGALAAIGPVLVALARGFDDVLLAAVVCLVSACAAAAVNLARTGRRRTIVATSAGDPIVRPRFERALGEQLIAGCTDGSPTGYRARATTGSARDERAFLRGDVADPRPLAQPLSRIAERSP